MSLLNYKQQANEPTWFKENEDHFYHSVTSGSSPFNEWYEFETEDDALGFALTFESQSVIDHYARVSSERLPDRWYELDDVEFLPSEVCSVSLVAVPIEKATPASFADLAQAESRF